MISNHYNFFIIIIIIKKRKFNTDLKIPMESLHSSMNYSDLNPTLMIEF